MTLRNVASEAPPRIVSFAWGFLFIQLFRYLLDKTYPFFSLNLSLSLFATILGALVFLAFWRYLPRSINISSRKSRTLAIASIGNAILFLTFILYQGESSYLYLFPLFFFLQVTIQLLLLSALLPFFAAYRLSLLAGVLPGLFPLAFFQSPWFIFSASAAMAVFPAGVISVRPLTTITGEKRMIPLRQSLDFLRFMLFAFALYGTFDIFRSRFYIVATILTLAGILQLAILKIHERKEHIKYGLVSLGVALPVIAGFYLFLPINFASAIGYTILSAWEAVFFRRASEGYLQRERWLILFIFAFSIFSYFLTLDWVIILIGVMAIIAQIRFLPFLFKQYRKLIGFLFIFSMFFWTISVFKKYNQSITRDFFLSGTTGKKGISSLANFLLPGPNTKVLTNLYPEEVIEKAANIHSGSLNVSYESLPSFILPLVLWKEFKFSSPTVARLYRADSLPPYANPEGFSIISEFISKNTGDHKKNQGIILAEPVTNNEKNIEILKGSLTESEKNRLKALGTAYADWLSDKGKYSEAVSVYKELIIIDQASADIFKRAAQASANAGEILSQIDYTERYLELSADRDPKVRFRLMELYFFAGNTEKSEAMVEQLLREDPGRALYYYRWLYRIKAGKVDKYYWQSLLNRVNFFNPGDDPMEQEKKVRLIADIKENIEASPAWFEIYQEELKRQEHLVFPDF